VCNTNQTSPCGSSDTKPLESVIPSQVSERGGPPQAPMDASDLNPTELACSSSLKSDAPIWNACAGSTNPC